MPTSGDPQVSAAQRAMPPLAQARLWKVTTGAAVAAGLLAVGLFLAGLWLAGFPKLRSSGTVGSSALFELAKIALAVVAGIGGVVALVAAYRRQQVLEAGNKLAEASNERAIEENRRNEIRLREERFARTSEQLGSEKPAVRLAGVYAMAALADDWEEGRQQCVDVLCAYMRLPHHPEEPNGEERRLKVGPYRRARSPLQESPFENHAFMEEEEVRRTVIRIITSRLQRGAVVPWRGVNLDFTGASLRAVKFDGAILSGGYVSFKGVNFQGADITFNQAEFSGASVLFSEARFVNASVSLVGVTLSGGKISFGGAVFDRSIVTIRDSKFTGGRLTFGGIKMLSGRISISNCHPLHSDVSFSHSRLSGGRITLGVEVDNSVLDFSYMLINGGHLIFAKAKFLDKGGFKFRDAKLLAGGVRFKLVEFNGGQMSLAHMATRGGEVSFSECRFTSGAVTFRKSLFIGGTVVVEACRFGDGFINLRSRHVEATALVTDLIGESASYIRNSAGFLGAGPLLVPPTQEAPSPECDQPIQVDDACVLET